jgi:GH43 family beta-xylosidase
MYVLENSSANPLDDPNRHARAQVLEFSEDGSPIFGIPLPDRAQGEGAE